MKKRFEFSYETQAETFKILNFYERYLRNKMEGNVVELAPTPRYYDYDAIVFVNSERKLHIEVKVRSKISVYKFAETKIPLRKHAVAMYFNKNHEIRTKYLCLFSEGLFSLNLHDNPDNVISMPNRWDRGGEMCEYAMYDITRFKSLDYS